MAAPKKYRDELRERALRMAVELMQHPATRQGSIQRVAEQLGMHPETCATGSGRSRSTAARVWARPPPRCSESRSSSSTSVLKRTNEILKASAASFAVAELDRKIK